MTNKFSPMWFVYAVNGSRIRPCGVHPPEFTEGNGVRQCYPLRSFLSGFINEMNKEIVLSIGENNSTDIF